jgi:ankyrin repeat protein
MQAFNGYTALLWAAGNGHEARAEARGGGRGARPAKQQGKHCSAYNGHEARVQRLVAAGAGLDLQASDSSDGSTALILAADQEPDIVVWLIEPGANIGLADNEGGTANTILHNTVNTTIETLRRRYVNTQL